MYGVFVYIVQLGTLLQMTAREISSGSDHEDHCNLQHLNVVKIAIFAYVPLLGNSDVPLNSMAAFPVQ